MGTWCQEIKSQTFILVEDKLNLTTASDCVATAIPGTFRNRRRQLTMANENVTFFGDITAHVPHVLSCCCVEDENARTWRLTSRREREHLIFCFEPY